MSIKETNLDKVIEEEIIQQKKVDEKVHVKFEDESEIGESMNEEVEVENKPDKPKKKLSIFRKSKKNKVNKNKETDELKTELLVGEDNTQENESKLNDSVNQTKEPENKLDISDEKKKDVPEKKSLFKRRSVKTKVIDEDVSTQTGQPEISDKNPDENTDLNDEDGKVHKERKRSFVKRISKLRKSSKWTNTSEEKNKEVTLEEKEVKPEEIIENQEDSFHDLVQEPTTSGNQDESKLDSPDYIKLDSPDNASVETFIVKDIVDNIAPGNPFVEKDISLNMSNEKNDIEEEKEVEGRFYETYESEFTTVTALPERSFEEEEAVTIENMTKDNSVDKTEMEEIPLLSDTQLAQCSSTQDPSDISISSEENITQEEKPKNLNFVLVGPLNNKEKDESFFLAKKAVKVYKNAQLSRTYCQSCCTLM